MEPPRPLKSPAEIVRELRLEESLEAPRGESGARVLEDLELRRRAFEWVHMGTSGLLLSELLAFFETGPFILAPRSGHLGNWTEIAQGRSGLLDSNAAVCRDSRFGYPLVYDLNQTEDRDLIKGDVVYLPGSVVEQGARRELALWTWNGKGFSERSRDTSWFVPFVKTPVEGELAPLTRLHRARNERIPGYSFHYHSTTLRASDQRVRDVLRALVSAADAASNPSKRLSFVFDQIAELDGRVYRQRIERTANGYGIGDSFFPDSDALIEASLFPLMAADDPDTFFSRLEEAPPRMPLLSASINLLFYALLNTHYPGYAMDPERAGDPFCVHIHWGADQMAGYPPLKPGYFPSIGKDLRKVHSGLLAECPDPAVKPILFVLLPLSVFTVCPHSALPLDQELLDSLFVRLRQVLDARGGDPEKDGEAVEAVAREWWERSRKSLSGYFVASFTKLRSIHTDAEVPDPGVPVLLPSFLALSLREACLLVGALHQVLG